MPQNSLIENLTSPMPLSQPYAIDVDVVVPVYNGADFLKEALDSVVAQTARPKQVIVVDDCSTDQSVAIVEQYAVSCPIPLSLIRMKTNSGGPSRPINLAVSQCKSELVAVLDQDDVLLPHAFDSAYKKIVSCDRCGFVFHLAGELGDQLGKAYQSAEVIAEVKRLSDQHDSHTFVVPGREFIRLLNRYQNFVVGYPGFLFRKCLWTEKGGIDETLRVAGDLEFLLWLGAHHDVMMIDQVGYLRRKHDANVTGNHRLTVHESGLVFGRSGISEQETLGDECSIAAASRVQFMAYRMRNAGHHLEALELYRLSSRFDGQRMRAFREITKTIVHWIASSIGLIKPTPLA